MKKPSPLFRAARWCAHPIRLSGILSLAILVGPGSLQGLSLLLVHAGFPPVIRVVAPATHAFLQLAGFFLILIWGFLVHGLPGMMGVNVLRTKHIRWPMLVTAAGLFLAWLAEARGVSEIRLLLARLIALAGMASGTFILVAAAFSSKDRWQERPFPFLISSLAIPPVAVAMFWFPGAGAAAGATDLMLLGAIAPIIIAMGYRMFAPMVGLQMPRDRWFDAGSLLWGLGVILRVILRIEGLPLTAADGALFLGAVAFTVALRVLEPRRQHANSKFPGIDGALLQYLRWGFFFLILSGTVRLLSQREWIPGNPFYWDDLGRHYVALGFCLLAVMGLTQRVFPTFLRGAHASAGWMYFNLYAIVIGLILRSAEPFLPATGEWVRAGAFFLYGGIVSFALHLIRGMVVPNRQLAEAARARALARQEKAE